LPGRAEPVSLAFEDEGDGAARVLAALAAGGFTVAFLFFVGYDALRHVHGNRQLEMLLLSLFPVPGILGGIAAALLAPSRRWQVALPLAILSTLGWIVINIMLIAIGGGSLPPAFLIYALLSIGALIATFHAFRIPRLPIAAALAPPLALFLLLIGSNINKRVQAQTNEELRRDMIAATESFLYREVFAGHPVIRWNPYIGLSPSGNQAFGETDGAPYARVDVIKPEINNRPSSPSIPLTIIILIGLNKSSNSPPSADQQYLKSLVADSGIKRELLDRLGADLTGTYGSVQYQVQFSENQSHATLRCWGYFPAP